MDLSLVDLSPVPPGGTPVDALRDTVALAQRVEELGYSRFWLAEHHGGSAVASSAPEVLIARVAAMTTRIRVGSGTVLLNHYSPYKVAEVFRTLHAMTPERIDLGVGRADGIPAADFALQRDRSAIQDFDDYDAQVTEVMAWLDSAFPAGHAFAGVPILPGVPGGPQPWVLGSSPGSAVVAGRLGLRYCFAAFINPGAATVAADTYRSSFRPSMFPSGLTRPRLALAVNAVVGETERDGDRLRATAELLRRRSSSPRAPQGPLPSADAAVAELGGVPAPTELSRGSWPKHLSGGPQRVRQMLESMAAEVGAHEIVLQDRIARRTDRIRSYELLADAFALPAQRPAAGRVAGAAVDCR